MIVWNLRVPSRSWPLGSILDGNWDTAFRRPVDIAWKIQSMRQRFVEGLAWRETDLFRHFYAPSFRGTPGAIIKGARSLDELSSHYERVYDSLYASLRDSGFRTASLTDPGIVYAYVHFDRDGCPMYTSEANHRLGMALALGLSAIPVRVATRHASWQSVRESVFRGREVPERYRTHPDLQDLRAVAENPVLGQP
jgi:hypothetical protein